MYLEDATDHPLTEGERVGLELVGDRAASHDRPERPSAWMRYTALDSASSRLIACSAICSSTAVVSSVADLPSNVDEGGHLFRSVVRLAIQAGVLDRRPDASRDRREQPLFVHAEATLLLRFGH